MCRRSYGTIGSSFSRKWPNSAACQPDFLKRPDGRDHGFPILGRHDLFATYRVTIDERAQVVELEPLDYGADVAQPVGLAQAA